MTYGYSELTVGGVLFAAFVPYAVGAFVIFLLTRPLFRLVPVEAIFANPPLVSVCVYVLILAFLMVVF